MDAPVGSDVSFVVSLVCNGGAVRDQDGMEQTFKRVVRVSEVVPLIATWKVAGEAFHTVTVDPEVARAVMDTWLGYGDPKFPIGRLHRGSGVAEHNKPWNWNMNPLALTEVAAEVCDGRPSDVEKDLDYWIGTVKSFCPWSARLSDLRIWSDA